MRRRVIFTRRKFIKLASLTGITLSVLGLLSCSPNHRGTDSESGSGPESLNGPIPSYDSTEKTSAKSKVYLVMTDNRKEGVKRCLALLGPLEYAEKKVLLKPNFNTADPAPGSTHNHTLEQLLIEIQSTRPASLAVGERSGPPLTEDVLKEKGVLDLCQRLGVPIINYDQLSAEELIKFHREGLHWQDGFLIPKPIVDADINIATCLLKTHGYGGVFSMALKLTVGLVPRRGYPYMKELHSSPNMEKMIAEINLAYDPDFVLMDGIDVFVDGGPDKGTRKKANVMLISRDRVALDAVGLAILKDLGSNETIMETPIFQHKQIARAVELSIGVSNAKDIEIVSDDVKGEQYGQRLMEILRLS